MEPIGILMKEHRLIERMLRILENEREACKKSGKVDLNFLEAFIDFFHVYVDKNHHGREEDIVFRGLDRKKINFEHRRLISKLIEDHRAARNIVNGLDIAQKKYSHDNKTLCSEVTFFIDRLLTLYKGHIELEDKHFFYPAMTYLTEEERNQMVEELQESSFQGDQEECQRMIEEFERGVVEIAEKTE